MKKQNKSFRYTLERCIGNRKKFICPNCGQRTFVRYIDVETGKPLGEGIGRCDREINCGYHKKPRDYFSEQLHTCQRSQPVRLSPLLFSEKNSDFFCVQRDRMVSKQFSVLHGTDNVHIWAADRNHLFFHPGFFHHSCNLLPSVPVLLFIGALPEINNDL